MSHDAQAARFETALDGQVCSVEYRLDRSRNEVVFTHTYVPLSLRGHGIAAALVDVALAWARSEGLNVVPACSYVRSHLRREQRSRSRAPDGGPR